MSMSVQNSAPIRGVSAYTSVQNTAKPAQEKKEENSQLAKETKDTFVKSNSYRMDMDAVREIKANYANNLAAFRQMVNNLLNRQGRTAYTALGKELDIDTVTQLEAQNAIAEDGYWGVQKTATRILDFAKALSGSDPSKIPLLRDAVQKGFEAATAAWGGALPDICQQTLQEVMKGFDEWEAQVSSKPGESGSTK